MAEQTKIIEDMKAIVEEIRLVVTDPETSLSPGSVRALLWAKATLSAWVEHLEIKPPIRIAGISIATWDRLAAAIDTELRTKRDHK